MKHKKYFITLVSLILVGCTSWVCGIELELAPYYNFGLTQGVSLQPGEWSFTVNLVNDMGLIVKPAEKHSILGFYEIKYLGPGLRAQEGERFTDRFMDHLYVVRHQWEYKEDMVFNSQLDYMKDLRRTGANEAWGFGLYDYERSGGLVGVQKDFKEFIVEGNLQFHYLRFPNYTDLLTEISADEGSVESSSGKQNQNMLQIGGRLDYRENSFLLGFSWQNYEKQKVIVNVVQPNGSFYSSTLQKEFTISIGAERLQKVKDIMLFVPSLSYKIRSSNQNYMHFEVPGSTSPASDFPYHPNYYSYSQIEINLPVTMSLSEKWDFVFSPTFGIKSYVDRNVRDENGNFIPGRKQTNNLTLIALAFNKKSSDVSTTSLFVTFQTQSSNMKYEKYYPYNYSGQFIGIEYTISY